MQRKLTQLVQNHIDRRREACRTELTNLDEAEVLLAQDVIPRWAIHIVSGWSSYGEKAHSGEYETKTLREAMKLAATDFCRLNHRTIPGQPIEYGTRKGQCYKTWDVQGDWSIRLVVGGVSVPVARDSYDTHLRVILRTGTDENFFSPPKKKAVTIS